LRQPVVFLSSSVGAWVNGQLLIDDDEEDQTWIAALARRRSQALEHGAVHSRS